jgi:hypothetical protein
VRPLLGRPFLMRSFRGLAFILLVATPFLVAALSGFAVVAIVWSKAQTLARWSGSLTFASVIGAYFTLAFRPFWRLPAMRTTLAPEWALSWRQMYGQLRLSHADDQRARFSLVRFYSSCAICRGTLEIRDGGRGWPGRLVGRCSDSPREHVFSFDPVTRTGRLLVER